MYLAKKFPDDENESNDRRVADGGSASPLLINGASNYSVRELSTRLPRDQSARLRPRSLSTLFIEIQLLRSLDVPPDFIRHCKHTRKLQITTYEINTIMSLMSYACEPDYGLSMLHSNAV